MSTNRVIFVIGILVLAVPFAGFPRGWEEGFLILAGVVLILLSSLNIWQRSIVKRLKFHSKKIDVVEEEKVEAPELHTQDEENITEQASQRE